LEIYDEEPPKSDKTSVAVAKEAEAIVDFIVQMDNGLKGTGARNKSGRKINFLHDFVCN